MNKHINWAFKLALIFAMISTAGNTTLQILQKDYSTTLLSIVIGMWQMNTLLFFKSGEFKQELIDELFKFNGTLMEDNIKLAQEARLLRPSSPNTLPDELKK